MDSTTWLPDSVNAVVFDLFGTLVPAPTAEERDDGVRRIAGCLRVPPARVSRALSASWRVRHNGTLAGTVEVAGHLVRACTAEPAAVPVLAACLTGLAAPRLRTSARVIDTLVTLRASGIRVGVLTDIAADVAEVWTGCELAGVVDAAVFSCRYGRLKPERELYLAALELLAVDAGRALYCGDGGGSELAGACRVGMRAIAVRRLGGPDALAFGEVPWSGATVSGVEALPALLASGCPR
jgi:putative hydrolase of the HAD superfamily